MKMQEEKMDMNGMRNPDFWKEYYQNVQTQIGRINNMLKDLWTASERPAFEFADKVQLQQVINEAVGQLTEALTAKNIQVENKVPDSLPALNVDKPKFYRLFELLLKDEIATLPPGSRVTISASAQNHSPPDKQSVQVQVSDNGPGLPSEALRLVFDPFVVRSDSPVEYGIHLMACYFIVHHHGGKIDAKSAEGEGTTFTIRLPVNPNQTSTPPENEPDFLQKVLLNDTLWEKLISSE
jgi:signal transduction histidine kinase